MTTSTPDPEASHSSEGKRGKWSRVFFRRDPNSKLFIDRNLQQVSLYERTELFSGAHSPAPCCWYRNLSAGGRRRRRGFTGHYYHQPSGLHLALYRAYDADLGRWLSRDPIAENAGINLYSYVVNDPVSLWDPLGLIDIGFEGYGTVTMSGGTRDTIGNVALRNYVNGIGGTVYDRTQNGQEQALQAIQNALATNPDEPVNIYGYSRGAAAANELAAKCKAKGIDVDQLTLIDPVGILPPGSPQSLTVPFNVKKADDYYQTNGGPFSGGPLANPSANFLNHNVTRPGISHNTIVANVLGAGG